jgi:hypothetical protein
MDDPEFKIVKRFSAHTFATALADTPVVLVIVPRQ